LSLVALSEHRVRMTTYPELFQTCSRSRFSGVPKAIGSVADAVQTPAGAILPARDLFTNGGTIFPEFWQGISLLPTPYIINAICGLGLKARKEKLMFGRMSVDAMLTVERGCDVLAAVRSLVERAEGVEVMKWMEFPDSILVFLMIPGDVTSGSIYVLDRRSGVWYWIDFEDSQYGGYSQEELERLLTEGNLLALIERPGLLGSGLKWVVKCGQVPVAT